MDNCARCGGKMEFSYVAFNSDWYRCADCGLMSERQHIAPEMPRALFLISAMWDAIHDSERAPDAYTVTFEDYVYLCDILAKAAPSPTLPIVVQPADELSALYQVKGYDEEDEEEDAWANELRSETLDAYKALVLSTMAKSSQDGQHE